MFFVNFEGFTVKNSRDVKEIKARVTNMLGDALEKKQVSSRIYTNREAADQALHKGNRN